MAGFNPVVDHWCTAVSSVRQIPKHNASVLLHDNIRNDQLLHRRPLSTTTPRLQFITPKLWLSRPTTSKPRSIILPRATKPKRQVLHRGPQVQLCSSLLHHMNGRILHRSHQFTIMGKYSVTFYRYKYASY